MTADWGGCGPQIRLILLDAWEEYCEETWPDLPAATADRLAVGLGEGERIYPHERIYRPYRGEDESPETRREIARKTRKKKYVPRPRPAQAPLPPLPPLPPRPPVYQPPPRDYREEQRLAFYLQAVRAARSRRRSGYPEYPEYPEMYPDMPPEVREQWAVLP